jgi:hypothetical protein
VVQTYPQAVGDNQYGANHYKNERKWGFCFEQVLSLSSLLKFLGNYLV